MKVLVFFSPVSDGMNSEVFMRALEQFKENPFEETLKQLKKGFKENLKADHSKILLLPTYTTGIHFLKGSNEITGMKVLDKENASLKENRFSYFQFKEGEYLKVTGNIVSFDLDDPEKKDEDEVANSLFKYDKMGSNEKKRFRQKAGKKFIQYLSNAAVINQMNNWASVNDASEIEEMGEMQKNQGNKGTREPSSPVSAYSKVTKNMWVIYFNPNDAHKIEENAKSWDNISDADREYRYQQVEKRLKVLNDQIGTLDENIKKELDIIESRRIEKQKMSALYGDEAGMKSRLNKIKEEKQKIKDEQNEINTTPLSPSATEVEKDMVDWKLKNLDSQDTTLTTESAEIEKVLKSDELDKISLEKMQNWKEEQIKLIESKKEVEASQVKSKKEYEAERELETRKEWAESLIGIKTGIPLRYMYVPEVKVISYSETVNLSEKSEGTFEIVVKQIIRNGQYAKVGDPISLGIKGIGKVTDKIGKIIGVGGIGNANSNKTKF